jgi:hypothetical protein
MSAVVRVLLADEPPSAVGVIPRRGRSRHTFILLPTNLSSDMSVSPADDRTDREAGR